MEYWSILEINPTNDESIIKKAYAKKLKIHHPEVDPQGYQKLRQAYDNALKHAKRMTESKQFYHTESSVDIELVTETLPISKDFLNEEDYEHTVSNHPPIHIELLPNKPQYNPSIETQNTEFMLGVESLYNDFFSRIDIENWKQLLNNDIIWNIRNKKTISKLMLDFLSNHHYLPQDIWLLLDNNFNWCNMDNSIQHSYSDKFVAYIKKQIERAKPSNYLFSKSHESVDFEKYLESRENAQESFLKNNFSDANYYIECAKKIYKDDPDLLRLECEIYMRKGNYDGAIPILNTLLSLNPNDSDAIVYRATIYYEKNLIKQCLEDFGRVYSKVPNKKEVYILLAKSYFKIGNLEKSKELALKALKIKLSQNDAKLLLSQIYVKLRKNLTEELEKDPSNKELKLILDVTNSEMYKNNRINSKIFDKVNIISILKFIPIVILIAILGIATKFGVLILLYFFIKSLTKKNK